MSTTIKADASGSVTIPAEVCRAVGVEPGTDVAIDVQNGEIVLRRPRRPIWEEIADLVKDIPPEEFDKLPPGGAAGIDNYLYGHPKLPE
jgi:antitoxin component of MazEF toxin-antitoxin module